MAASSPQLVFQASHNQEENNRKAFIFKQVLNKDRQNPQEIIADFRECLRKTKALFLLRESREPGYISVTYRRNVKSNNYGHIRYAYSSHQWTNVLRYSRQQQCGLLNLGNVDVPLSFELIEKSLKGKYATYPLMDSEKYESKSAELLSAVVVFANETLYYVDLKTQGMFQILDEASDILVTDIAHLEQGSYETANEAQLNLIAAMTNKDRHKKLEFTPIDRETIGNKGRELLELVQQEQGLTEEQMLLPKDDQVTEKMEYTDNAYRSSAGIMQQLERQFQDFGLQPQPFAASSKRQRLSDGSRDSTSYQFFQRENVVNDPPRDWLSYLADDSRKRKHYTG